MQRLDRAANTVRIGIDGYNLAISKGTGVSTYGAELASVLQSIGHRVDGVFGIAVPKDVSLREAAFFDALSPPAATIRRAPRYRRAVRLARSFRAPQALTVPLTGAVDKGGLDRFPAFDSLVSAAGLFENAFKVFSLTGRFVKLRLPSPPEVMHWTYPVPVTMVGSRNVYTLHDLVPLKLPYTTLDNKPFYGRLLARCVATAAQICTVSEASKRDIIEQFGCSPDRVTNTYQISTLPGRLADVSAVDSMRAVGGIFGLEQHGYFLYYGSIEPKKNIGRLIEAYLSLQSATPLVLVSARGWKSEHELRLMPGDGAEGAVGVFDGHRGQRIIRLDYLSRDLLAKLIRGAKALVFPSLYEGFGLPVLEAMQLGTAVITSNTSSLPEVAGDAGLLVDPYDVDALRQAMQRVDNDEALRRRLAERGLARATLFSRDRYSERLTELYRAAMAHS